MQTISVITVICGSYEEVQRENIIACESREDADVLLERVKIHNNLWLQATDEQRMLHGNWIEKNPAPVFSEPRPQYDRALSNDRQHMREHSKRMQEWNSAHSKHVVSRLTPWSETSEKAAADIMQECLDQAFSSSVVGRDEFKYDCIGGSDNRYRVESIPLSKLHANNIKPKI